MRNPNKISLQLVYILVLGYKDRYKFLIDNGKKEKNYPSTTRKRGKIDESDALQPFCGV